MSLAGSHIPCLPWKTENNSENHQLPALPSYQHLSAKKNKLSLEQKKIAENAKWCQETHYFTLSFSLADDMNKSLLLWTKHAKSIFLRTFIHTFIHMSLSYISEKTRKITEFHVELLFFFQLNIVFRFFFSFIYPTDTEDTANLLGTTKNYKDPRVNINISVEF